MLRRKRRRRAAPRRGGARARAPRRPAVHQLSREQLEKLEQRQLDVIGLTLVAVGVYLTFVLYLSWDGGKVGGGAQEALTYLFGKVAYVAPLAFFACGAALILKPFLPAIRPLRTGGICIIAGLLLAFAAQTAHIGPDHPIRHQYFDSRWFPDHGGLVGESLYWATATLFQRLGAHIVALFLIAAGGLLVTGTSIATFLSSTGRAITKAKASSAEMARTVAQTNWQRDDAFAAAATRGAPTEVMSGYPDEELEPTVRVVEFDQEPDPEPEFPESEAPTGELAAGEAADGGDGEEPEAVEAEPGVEQPVPVEPADEVERTPMGNGRGVTQSEEIDYKPPPVKVLEKGKADSGPDP